MRLFDKNMVHISGDVLRKRIIELESAVVIIRKELESRTGDGNSFVYGYLTPQGFTGFENMSAAVDAIVKETGDPDAGYFVDKVYT